MPGEPSLPATSTSFPASGDSLARTRFTVALAGQPNAGKSTVFNLLTGLSQHVGNWPGKTVEQRTGTHVHDGVELEIVDLPGTYSLTAASQEEVVARDFIIASRPDVVVAVINAAQLERHLYLVAELAVLPGPLVVAVNMMDIAAERGVEIDVGALDRALGVPVVPMVARRNQGVHELIHTVVAVIEGTLVPHPARPSIRADHAAVCTSLESLVAGCAPDGYPDDWIALKLLEGDAEVTSVMQRALGQGWDAVHDILKAHDDAGLAVAGGRYEWIARLARTCVAPRRVGEVTFTERLDRWATHPVWGLGLLTLVLGTVYALTFAVGSPLQSVIAARLIGPLAGAAGRALAGGPWWLRGLVADGLLGGVGTVLSFLPILVIFFAALALIEDTGYMARAAYVMDRFMHHMGLHGKSALPLLLGFGCNVPAVMGARILESRRARLLKIMLAPLVPCASRMAVVVFLAPVFFGVWAPVVAVGLVALPLATLALAGAIVNLLVFKGQRTAFIMEIPLYHRPSARTVGMQVWRSSKEFVAKAGTLILLFSTALWAASAFPRGDLAGSLLGRLGAWLEPVGALMGLDWRMMVALLSSFVAKENAIATFGVLFGGVGPVADGLSGAVAPSGALAYLVAQMLFVPCAATVVTIKQEAGGWRWALLSVAVLAVVSLAAAMLTFQIARRF